MKEQTKNEDSNKKNQRQGRLKLEHPTLPGISKITSTNMMPNSLSPDSCSPLSAHRNHNNFEASEERSISPSP